MKFFQRRFSAFKTSQAGTTIIEILLAAAILGLVMTSIVSVITLSVKNTAEARERAQAVKYMQEGAEFFRQQYNTMGWETFVAFFQSGPADYTYCLATIPQNTANGTAGSLLQVQTNHCATDEFISNDPKKIFQRQAVATVAQTTVNGAITTTVTVTVTVTWYQGDKLKTSSVVEKFGHDATTGYVIPSTFPSPSPNGLVGRWQLNEPSWNGTDNEIIDSSGYGNFGVAKGHEGTVSNMGTNYIIDYNVGYSWYTDTFIGFPVTITGGTGEGQTQLLIHNNAQKLTTTNDWTTIPDTTSTYRLTATTASYTPSGGGSTRAGNFDGSDTYAEVPYNPQIDMSNSSFTITAWVNPSATIHSSELIIASHAYTTPTLTDYFIELNGAASPYIFRGKTYATDGNSLGYCDSSSIVAANTWSLVAYSFDNTTKVGTCTVYGTGTNYSQTASSTSTKTRVTPVANLPFQIGDAKIMSDSVANTAKFHFAGKISDVRIYERVLNNAELDNLHTAFLPLH